MRARAVAATLAAAALVACGGGPDERGAHVRTFDLRSEAVGRELPVTVTRPPHAARRPPVLVLLHGRDGDETSAFVEEFFAGLEALGPQAPVVVQPYGDEASFWHDRDDGAWGRYVVDEVLPAVARRYAVDAGRVAIGGISMGGFGALDLARLHPGRFCAVGGHAAALWRTAGETAEGAFDDAQDFAEHDLIAAAQRDPSPFLEQPVWLDVGDEDPFRPGAEALAAALRAAGADVRLEVGEGEHDGSYWDSRWRRYLRFYADALARC